MAVTKELITAIPYESGSNVNTWELDMLYKQGDTSIDPETKETIYAANYYELDFRSVVKATEYYPEGNVTNFTPKPKGDFTLAELTALCPTSKLDGIFTQQYNKVITSHPTVETPDKDFEIPTE